MGVERWLLAMGQRVRSLFRGERADAELDEELRDHVERQTEENRRRGMSAEEARRAALIAMGGVEQQKQQCREARGVHWMEDLGRDAAYGWRTMRRSPGFTVTALLILGLGIGANTAIFSADHALLFRHLPYRNAGRLAEVFQKPVREPGVDTMPVAPGNYADWKNNQVFEETAAWREVFLNLSGGENPERVRAAEVEANLFSVLGVKPAVGRGFERSEETPGRDAEAILSYGLWQRRFGGKSDVVGKTMRANDRVYTVVGVMREGFRFPIGWEPTDVEVWTPLALTGSEWTSREAITLSVVGRLREGVSLRQAQASLDAVAEGEARAWPETNRAWSLQVLWLGDRGVRGFRGLFVLLSIAVGLVLLIACANVANLLLARGMERQRELTVRSALGAKRGRLVRQVMTEGVLLALAGGGLGMGLGYAGIRVLASMAPVMDLPDLKGMSLNPAVVALAVGLSVVTGMLFSVLPALTLSGVSLRGTMQQGGRGGTETRRGHRLKAALATGEVALTLALLLCAGDIVNSFVRYMSRDPGFDAHNVLTMHMMLRGQKYRDPQQWAAFFGRAVEELRAIPGVAGAAAGSGAPMEENGTVMRFHREGQAATAGFGGGSISEYDRVTPGYLAVTGMRLARGRSVVDSDTASARAVAVVNETFARKQFGGADPIGKRIYLDGDVNASATAETAKAPLEIVGVVHDTKEYGMFQITPQMIYVPLAQDPERSVTLLVKTTWPVADVAGAVRGKLAKMDADEPVYNMRSLEEIFDETHAFFRFNTVLLGAFAGMALVLSLIGIYGVVAYGVSQRTREFGIRLALGSPRGEILLLVLRQAGWVAAGGIGAGLLLAWPAVGLLTRTLHESMYLTLLRTGPVLYPALCGAAAATLLAASLIPARAATQADPMDALRCE